MIIAIFSSRDYAGKWFPPNEKFVLRYDEWICSDCLTECIHNNKCLKNIKVEKVISLVSELLD